MITRNNGFAWTVLVDGVNYKIETNTLDNEEAFKEAIFLKTGARWWSESAIKRYRSSHETKIIGRPVKLNRKARCIANRNV